MKLTNKAGLPDAICRAAAAQQSEYIAGKGDGDISATTLIAPPQIDALVRQHEDKLSEDVSDRLWAIMGTAMHNILEAAETEAKVEERLYGQFCGWKVSGKYDRMLISKGLLQDYKFCSVYEYIFGLKEDRVAQLNVLAQLAVMNGYTVNNLEVVMLFRDWRPADAQRDPKGYPQQQIARIPVTMWPEQKRISYIEQRVHLHQAARNGERIHCTDEERWVNGQKWAVMKKGRKSALKLCDSEGAAHQYLMERGLSDADNVHYIEFRPGKYARCERYCPAKDVCPQYQHDRRES